MLSGYTGPTGSDLAQLVSKQSDAAIKHLRGRLGNIRSELPACMAPRRLGLSYKEK